jgi:hypothetical protein
VTVPSPLHRRAVGLLIKRKGIEVRAGERKRRGGGRLAPWYASSSPTERRSSL